MRLGPAQHPEGSECVPFAGSADLFHVEPDSAGVPFLHGPGAVFALASSEDIERVTVSLVLGAIPGAFGRRWVPGLGRCVVVPPGPETDARMSWSPCLIRSATPAGRVRVQLGHAVVDDYLGRSEELV